MSKINIRNTVETFGIIAVVLSLVPEFRFWDPRMVANGSWESQRLRPAFKKAVEDAQASN
jgi:hypothetical protein